MKKRERVGAPYRPAAAGEESRTDADFRGWYIKAERHGSLIAYHWVAPDGRVFVATAEVWGGVPIPPRAEEYARRLARRG